MNQDDAIEDRGATARSDPAVGLVAPATRRLMLDESVVVDVIVPVDEIRAIEAALGTLALEKRTNIETKERTAKGHHDRSIRAVRLLTRFDAAHVEAMVLMDTNVVEL